MGEVYKAYDTHRDRYVALKLLPEAFSGDREYLKRFQRESHVAARLTEPHVIPIHDFGEIDGQLFIDMRLVEGADISALLDANGRIPPEQAVYLIGQVAQALDAAHADNLVHRDIKPSNILVTPTDFVYVVDFGIARSVGGRQTALTITGATIGTLHYMAPERFIGHDVDGRADVYSLACVLHECLTGEPPFTGKDLAALMYAQLYYGPPPASSLVEGIPPALDAVIARGMAKQPEDRFPTAGAMAEAAREALTSGAPASPLPPLPQAPLPPPPPMSELPTARWDETPAAAWNETPAPTWGETPASTWHETPAPTWGETPAPTWGETPAPTWNETSAPTRQDAVVVDAWQGAPPPGPETEPAGDRFAHGVPYSPTQSVAAVGDGNWGGTLPPEGMLQGARPDPFGSQPPPPGAGTGGPERGPGWRRLGLLIVAAAAVVAVPIVLVLVASKPHGNVTPPPHGSSSATAGPTGATSSASTLAAPTFGGKIPVGHNPSFIQVAPNGKFAYITNPGANAINVLNTATNLPSATIKIPQGPPQAVTFSPDSRTAYVTVYQTRGPAHLVAFIDTATNTVTTTVAVDNFTPDHPAVSPDGRFLYVANHNQVNGGTNQNIVDVIDTASKTLVGKIPVPANPHWIVFDKNGRFYTTDHLSATVTVVNARNNSIIKEISVGETPHSEAISPDGKTLAVTSYSGNAVFLIDTATDKMIKQIPVGQEPVGIAYSPDGRYLCTVNNLDDTVTVIDTADNHVITNFPTGKAPTSIAMLNNGRAYVTDENDGSIEVLNFAK